MSVRVESVRLNVDDVDWVGIAFEDTGVLLLFGFDSDVCGVVSLDSKKRRVHVTHFKAVEPPILYLGRIGEEEEADGDSFE